MNINKKVVEGAAVAVFVMAITVTSVATDHVDTKVKYAQEELYHEDIAAATKEKAIVDVVAAAKGAEVAETSLPKSEEEKKSELSEKEEKQESIEDVKEQESDQKTEETQPKQEEGVKEEQSPKDKEEVQEPEQGEESKEAALEDSKQEESSKPEGNAEKEQPDETKDIKEEQPKETKDVEEEQPKETKDVEEEQPKETKDVEEEQPEETKDVQEVQAKQNGAAGESNSSEEAENTTEAENQQEAEQQQEEQKASEWAAKLMPNVEEYLNIRGEANEEAEVLGKLRRGDAADIIERGEEWSKISSGSVEGYVKNEFCVFDEAAEAMAHELGTVYATASTGGLRVRAQADSSDETEIVHVMEEGEKVKVDTQAEVPEGWVAVKNSDTTAFVSAEYVTVELKLGKAISIEEEREAIRRAEEEAAAKQRQAEKSSSQTSSGGTQQRGAVAASYDDVTLLGALIQCEAGGECYEGQVAVGAVVMNRLRNGYAGSIYGVIYQSGQFAPASSGALASVLANGVSGSCLSAAQEAINGADNVGGATQFRSASSGQAGIVIGNHVFY